MYANTLLYVRQRLEGFCSRPNMYLDINEVHSGNNSPEMDPLRNAKKKNASALFRNFAMWRSTVPA